MQCDFDDASNNSNSDTYSSDNSENSNYGADNDTQYNKENSFKLEGMNQFKNITIVLLRLLIVSNVLSLVIQCNIDLIQHINHINNELTSTIYIDILLLLV